MRDIAGHLRDSYCEPARYPKPPRAQFPPALTRAEIPQSLTTHQPITSEPLAHPRTPPDPILATPECSSMTELPPPVPSFIAPFFIRTPAPILPALPTSVSSRLPSHPTLSSYLSSYLPPSSAMSAPLPAPLILTPSRAATPLSAPINRHIHTLLALQPTAFKKHNHSAGTRSIMCALAPAAAACTFCMQVSCQEAVCLVTLRFMCGGGDFKMRCLRLRGAAGCSDAGLHDG